MSWFKVDDAFAFHPKALAAGNAALGLWVRAGSWCSAHSSTQGALQRHMIGTLGAQRRDAERLVSAGLWCETEDGYQFKDWTDYQPTKEQADALKAANRERQQRHRQRKSNAVSHAVTDTVTNAVSHSTPSRPVLKDKEIPVSRATTKRKLHQIPEDWAPIDSHREKAEKRGVDLAHETDQFRSWALGKDERKANWDQAFHVWIGNAKPTLRLAHSAPLSTSSGAVTAFLREMWQAGRAKAVADRSGLRYVQPDVPDNITTGAAAWVKQQARDWITAHHDEALAAIIGKDAA